MIKRLLLTAAVLLSPFAAIAEENLIENGDFEGSGSDWPSGWVKPKAGGSLGDDVGNHFLRLQSEEPGQNLMAYKLVKVDPSMKELEFRCKIRVTDLKPGAQGWFDARIIMNFKDSGGAKVGQSPGAIYFRKDTSDWVEKTVKFEVPEGASGLEIMPSLVQVQSGTLDIDDVVLMPAAQ